MSFAVRCQVCGMPDFVDSGGTVNCPHCGMPCQAYQCGVPAKQAGPSNIIGDRIPKHMDWSLGQEVGSRSERKRVLAGRNMMDISPSEYKNKFGGLEKHGTAYSYAGKTHNKSTAERRQIV